MIIELSIVARTKYYGDGYICGTGNACLTVGGLPTSTYITLYAHLENGLDVVEGMFTSNSGEYMFTTLNTKYKYSIESTAHSVDYDIYHKGYISPPTNLTHASQHFIKNNIKNNVLVTVDDIEPYPITISEPVKTQCITHGNDAISGFIEGSYVDKLLTISLVYDSTSFYTSSTDGTYTFNNINTYNVYLEYNGKRQVVSKYNTNMKKGYITGSVNSSCDGTDFKIRVYREDGFFIGDYDIAENGSYEIPNLNVHSSYDVLLYDLNLAVETQVNSRRVPTAYSVSE